MNKASTATTNAIQNPRRWLKTKEISHIEEWVEKTINNTIPPDIAAEKIKILPEPSIEKARQYIHNRHSLIKGNNTIADRQRQTLTELLTCLNEHPNQITNSEEKPATPHHPLPISPCGETSTRPCNIQNNVLEKIHNVINQLGYSSINHLNSVLNGENQTPLNNDEFKILNEASLYLRLTDFASTPERLYDFHDTLERLGGTIAPTLNIHYVEEFEKDLINKKNTIFRYATIRPSTIQKWKNKIVENILEYTRPDFLQESHKLETDTPQKIDAHRAIALRQNQPESTMSGKDIFDAKLYAYVIDAYTLAPIHARNTDIEHLQSFDNFKTSLFTFFNTVNNGPIALKKVVRKKYPQSIIKAQNRQILPTEYTMRLLFNLFANTVLMSHYFNIVKGTKETGEVLQGSHNYGSPFVRYLSKTKDHTKITTLIDRWTLISTMKNNDSVEESFRGKPLYMAIQSWIDKGKMIQDLLILIREESDRREYLYTLANRLYKDVQLSPEDRNKILQLTIAALDKEQQKQPTTTIRAKLKAVILSQYEKLQKEASPNTLKAIAPSIEKPIPKPLTTYPVQDPHAGDTIASSDEKSASTSDKNSHTNRLINDQDNMSISSSISDPDQEVSLSKMDAIITRLTEENDAATTRLQQQQLKIQSHEQQHAQDSLRIQSLEQQHAQTILRMEQQQHTIDQQQHTIEQQQHTIDRLTHLVQQKDLRIQQLEKHK